MKSAVCPMCGRRRPRQPPGNKSAFDVDELIDVGENNIHEDKDGEYKQVREELEEEMDVDIETIDEVEALRPFQKKRGRPASNTSKKTKKREEVVNNDGDEDSFDASELIIDPDEGEEVLFSGGYRLPAQLYDNLFDYQRIGVRWMWELHRQNAGGIIGDEMVAHAYTLSRTRRCITHRQRMHAHESRSHMLASRTCSD
jgi:SNF2 family DNA or RNA helicase